MREVRTRDPWTNEVISYGALAKQRTVGDFTVYLSYRERDTMWWILMASPAKILLMGYIGARREVAWEVFFALTVESIEQLLLECAHINGGTVSLEDNDGPHN